MLYSRVAGTCEAPGETWGCSLPRRAEGRCCQESPGSLSSFRSFCTRHCVRHEERTLKRLNVRSFCTLLYDTCAESIITNSDHGFKQ